MYRWSLSLALLAWASLAPAASVTFADVCEPVRFKQTDQSLEIHCAAGLWMRVLDCAKPKQVRVRKTAYCAGDKYTVTCSQGLAAATIEVEEDPVLLACATMGGNYDQAPRN